MQHRFSISCQDKQEKMARLAKTRHREWGMGSREWGVEKTIPYSLFPNPYSPLFQLLFK